jgi:DNA-binding CsgD family transcriptional regulator
MKQTNAIKHMVILSEGLNDYCQPLQELGIHLFNVMINYDDNRQIYLCNNPLWVRDYYLYQLYKSSLYDNKPSLFAQDKYTLWEESFKQPILQFGLDFYDNRYGLTICHRREGYSAFYFFAGSKNNPHLPEFFINNFPLFERFIATFHYKKNHLIEEALAVGLKRHTKPSDSPWGEEAVKVLNKEQQILKNKYNLMEQEYSFNEALNPPLFNHLSRRQKQVLYGLSKGQSAREIAEQLNISRRTVERHLSILKIKFPTYSYTELLLELLSAKPKELLLSEL